MAKRICLHWSTSKPVKLVSFQDQIPPDIWSVHFGYLSVLSNECIIINIKKHREKREREFY